MRRYFLRPETQAKAPRFQSIGQMIVNELLTAIHPDYSIFALVNVVAQRRGRPIKLCPWKMQGIQEYGVWLAGPTTDYIFFESETAAFHQWQIIAHELAHMLLCHRTGRVGEDSLMSVAGCVLQRTYQTTQDKRELEAESLATLLQSSIIERNGLEAITSQVTTISAWQSLFSGLGFNNLK